MYQWFIQRMGNDVYRVVGKDMNVAPAHDPRQNTVSINDGLAEWTMKETDVPGVYGCAVSLLTFTFNKTRLVADPSDALTYTCTLKEVEIRQVTVLNVFCH